MNVIDKLNYQQKQIDELTSLVATFDKAITKSAIAAGAGSCGGVDTGHTEEAIINAISKVKSWPI